MGKKIKVLFQSRTELFEARGGDTYQIEHTKKAIEALDSNFEITIDNSVEVSNITDYDIVNLFNLDWICETYLQAVNAKSYNIPVVLSAIHHPVHKVELFEDTYKFGMRRIVNSLITSQQLRDTLKNIYRSIKYPRKIYPTLVQLSMGIFNQQQKIINLSDAILVQTDQEKKEIIELFDAKDKYFEKVVLGADSTVFLNASPNLFSEFLNSKNINLQGKKIILSVGRIEPRKNQLSLIEAFNNLKSQNLLDEYILVFIGAQNNNHPEYCYRFNRYVEAETSIYYLGVVDQPVVASAMSMSSLYAAISWFETFGLTNIEAYMAGVPVLSTVHRVSEYIKNGIAYCEPNDIDSISNGILEGIKLKPASLEDRKNISKVLSWEQTAKQTISVYKKLLGID